MNESRGARRYDPEMRTCARSGCSAPAAAILTYDRDAQTAYLYPVDRTTARTPGDLCDRHARTLVLPRAWHLDDHRGAALPAAAPPAPARRAGSAPKHRREPVPAGRDAGKWAEASPSLFDAAPRDAERPGDHTRDALAAAGADDVAGTDDAVAPVWMPRFGPDVDLDGDLDARTPLLRRAFGAQGAQHP